MANIIRRDPVLEIVNMRDALDRIFDEDSPRFPFNGWWRRDSAPAMDVYQTDDAVIVKTGLPGVKPEDIQVSVANGVLTIRGEVKEEKEEKEKTYHLKERRYGSFSRSVVLPNNVSTEKSEAEFEDGVLTLTLPKAEEAKAKTITVKAKK
jgi:HSP20 family protein